MANGAEDVVPEWDAVDWRYHEDNLRRLRLAVGEREAVDVVAGVLAVGAGAVRAGICCGPSSPLTLRLSGRWFCISVAGGKAISPLFGVCSRGALCRR